MQAGKTQTLTITEKTNQGFYLSDVNNETVFIANIFSENHWKKGDEVEVFI